MGAGSSMCHGIVQTYAWFLIYQEALRGYQADCWRGDDELEYHGFAPKNRVMD